MYSLPISIVIPCYNAEKTITRTLESVLHQNYRKIEIIIVDDGSTDGTAEIIENYTRKYEFITGLKQKNKGVSAARNHGINVAENEWVALLDSDDVFYKSSLTERVKAICENTNPKMLGVFCPAEMIFENGKKMGFGQFFGAVNPDGRVFFSHSSESIFAPSCVILNKQHFLNGGGFDETISTAEDYDLWQRMLRSGGYFQLVRGCKIGYTQHLGSAVHSKLLTHYRQCKIVAQRIASPSDMGIEECREGFGQSLYHISLTRRAMSMAFMAIATGQYAIAQTLLPDIRGYAMETMEIRKIESLLRFSTTRALCRHERDWFYTIWPEIHTDVIQFFEELNRRFEGRSQNVKAMLALFEENRYRRPVSVKRETNPGAIVSGWLSHLIIKARIYVSGGLKGFIIDSLNRLMYHEKRVVLLFCLLSLYTAGIIFLTIIVSLLLRK